MDEAEVTAILIQDINTAMVSTAQEIKTESTFMWVCTSHNPTTWRLGWCHESHNKVYYPQATITRQPSGRWHVYAHVHGTPGFYASEPNKELAMQTAEKHLEEVAKAKEAKPQSKAECPPAAKGTNARHK